MLDEAHERSLYTDIITGLLKKVRWRNWLQFLHWHLGFLDTEEA